MPQTNIDVKVVTKGQRSLDKLNDAFNKTEKAVEGATSDIEKFSKSGQKIRKAANGLEYFVDKAGRARKVTGQFVTTSERAAAGIDRVGNASRRAAGSVNKLSDAFSKLLTGYAAFQAVRFTILKTSELETQTKSLQVLTGSLETAKDVIAELQDFGAVTPFTSTELIETAKRLKAFGIETQDLVETTKRLGDVAGATGADLGGIATAFGQIAAKGRLQGEELLQLQERGIGLQDELQKMYNLTGDEFRKALEKGRISAKAVDIALQNLTDTGGKYANGAIAQSETLAGKFSTLVDGVTRIAQTLGNVLSPVLKKVLGEAIGVVNSINAALAAARRINQFGISARQRNDLFRQAGKEAEKIAKLRGGGKIDPGEFTRLRDERFKDLTEAYGFSSGQIEVKIKPVLDPNAQTIPDLLGGTSPKSGGKATTGGSVTPERAKSIEELLGFDWEKALGLMEAEKQLLLTQQQTQALSEGNTELFKQLDSARQYIRPLLEIKALEDAIVKSQQKLTEFSGDDVASLKLKNQLTEFRNQLLERQVKLEDKDAKDQNKSLVDDLAAANAFARIVQGVKPLNEELTQTEELLKGSFEIISGSLTSGIQGLIDGTKEWGDVLGNVLGQLGSMFLDTAFSSLGGSLGVPGFEGGGYTGDGPRAGGVDGKGGFPAILHPGEYVYDGFAAGRAAMGGAQRNASSDASVENSSSFSTTNNYMSAGSTERESSTVTNGSGSMVIETQVINNVEYATLDQVRAASAASAKQARSQVFSDLRNKQSRRAMVGLR